MSNEKHNLLCKQLTEVNEEIQKQNEISNIIVLNF